MNAHNTPHTTKRKGNPLLYALLAVIIVLLIAMIVVLGKQKSGTEVEVAKEEETKREVLVTEDNVEQVLADLEEASEKEYPASYQVIMNTDWDFPDGASASTNAYVENDVTNSTPVYFDVVRSDNGETIYKSPVIPQGESLRGIKLETDLDAGTYDCVLTYHLIDEEQNTLSTLNMALTINVAK